MRKEDLTMKKIYSAPEMTIVKVAVSHMVCLSAGMNGANITDASDFGARDGYDWDDED
jgi:hypothetical protein